MEIEYDEQIASNIGKQLLKLIAQNSSKFSIQTVDKSQSKENKSNLTNAEQLDIAKFAYNNKNKSKAARQFNVSEMTVRRCCKKFPQDKIDEQQGQLEQFKCLDPVMEKALFLWIVNQRSLKLRVTMADIKTKSLELSTKPGFKASNGWFDKFLKRWDISRRTPTHIMQKISDNVYNDIKQFYSDIMNYRLKVREEKKQIIFINIDETPVQLNFQQKTYEQQGKKEVLIQGIKNLKERITAVLMLSDSGIIFPPLLIIKGNNTKKLSNQYQEQCLIMANENAWITETYYLIYIKSVLLNLNYNKNEYSLCLIHDRCTSHLKPSISEILKQNDIKEFYIPSGCTSLVQVLDVSVNKSFKNHIHSSYNEWKRNQQQINSSIYIAKYQLSLRTDFIKQFHLSPYHKGRRKKTASSCQQFSLQGFF